MFQRLRKIFPWQLIRERLARFDSGLVVVLLVCLLAVWPFLSRPDLPQETDAELHVFRLAELSRMVRGGELYPRWAANYYYGYGYPFFNYYAPLTYYLGLGVELLPRLDAVDGVKALFVLGLVGAGLGMYAFVREYWGRGAGLVAAAVYVYAPYIQYVDPHARGDLAEAFSFAVFPTAMLALSRLHRRPGWAGWLAATGLVAAVILTHNLMAMVFFGLLLAWSGWLLLGTPVDRKLKGGLLFLSLGLGVGLAAFFWLPVALEQGAVNLSSLIGDGGHFDFRNHFLSWGELLAWPQRLDWGATEADFRLNLGPAQWILGGLGAVAVLAGRGQARRSAARGLAARGPAVYFVLVLGLLLFLMLPVSSWVWERLPFLPYLQFPWRLLGAAAAMLAVLAGAGTEAVSRWLPKRIGDFVPAVLVGGTLLMALPLSQVLPWPADFGPTSAARVVEIELAGRWLGTTSTADFVPATVDVLPKPASSLLQDLFNGRELDRVNRASLPPGTAVVSEEVTPLHYRYHSTSDRDYLLRLFLFDFPGWEAAVDGERVEIEIGRPEGFVVVPVPAGEHVIDVHFGNTPARGAAVWVSGLSLVGVVVVGWRLRRRKVDGDEVGAAMGRRVWRPGMVVGAAALMVFLGYLLI
jgi:hypothetical protein